MTASIDILNAPVAMVIELRASGQIDDKRWHELLAERPDLASALASDPRGGGASGWQPIETAPRDGTRIILAWGGRSVVGYYLDNSRTQYPWQGWKVPSLEDHPGGQPTDWQPFPAPPATLTQGAGDER